jgi:hypothetical protein
MAGKHIFSSSQWVQSGSTAEFKNGINVTGTVQADSFIGDGSNLTGIGTAVFFAGSGSGISGSPASSVDHVTELDAGAGATASAGYYRIETTSSADFNPNHFVFVKLTNQFETLQSGSEDFYVGVDRTDPPDSQGNAPFTNDLAPGVHRYIVYATDTGSAGSTQAVYTSAFIKGYVNVPPQIIAPVQSDAVRQIAHDANSLNYVMNFTASEEPNLDQGDFIRIFSASRLTTDPTAVETTVPNYALTMTHPDSNIPDSSILIATGTFDESGDYADQPGAGANASAIPNSQLFFSASITNYDVTSGTNDRIVNITTMQPCEENFEMTMFDNWYIFQSSSIEYSMSIVPPNTASINNIRLEFESGSYTGYATQSYRTTVLYDDVITRDNIDTLPNRYTSSLVRVAVMADITEPADYDPDPLHFTTVKIFSGSDVHLRLQSDSGIPRRHFQLFRFSGSTATGLFRATASTFLAPGADLLLSNVGGYSPTHSLGFTAFALSPQTFNYGFSGRASDLANTNYIAHGDYQHFSAQTGSVASLIIDPVPDIEISNIRVEVESGSFLTGEGAFERTASVLYGFTSSLQVTETSSLEGYEKSAEYISESVVRLRLLATVIEPFGPHHTKMISTLETSASSHPHSHVFEFHTGSGATHTASSEIAYDNQNRLVGHYTSSWINFNLKPGEYTFSASFDSATNAGRTITPGTYSEVSVSNTPATQITNIVYETETYGYSETGSTDTIRTVLYGVPRHTLANSSSFENHDSASVYASHSISRFRVLTDITEPFGPHHTASRFEKVWTAPGETSLNDIIHFSTASTDTASSAIDYDSSNRLFARYTSSWIGRQLSSSDNSSLTWKYTSGSITHTPDDLSGFTTASGLSTQLVVHDTDQIQLTNRIIEFEEHGYSASNEDGSTGETETSRTVLYGENHQISGISSSFENHIKADQYASQSVLRYRVKFKVTEPVGPAVGTIQIPIQRGIVPTYPIKTATTGSSDFLFINSIYDSQKRLVTDYTSSWQSGKNNELGESNHGGSEDFIYQIKDANVTSSLESQSENGINKAAQQEGTVTVHDTPATQITNIRYQTETFGYSKEPSTNTTRKVLYGVAHKTNEDSSSYENHDSASLYASQSVTRFRVLATITEPIGPLHTASRFEKAWTAGNESPITKVIHFSTASTDTASSDIAYNTSNQLVVHYTSSWLGEELASNNFNTGETWKYTSGSILHEPTNELGFTTASGESTTVTVFDTQPTIFSNFKTETETFGYSEIPIQEINRTVLYGNTTTDIDSASYESHANSGSYASQSVARFRVLATITEPVGPLQHTASVIEKMFNNDATKTETISFGTASAGFEASRSFFTEVGEFVTEYTSSWIGKALAPDTWSISTGSVTHDPAGENSANSSSFTSTTMIVNNTSQTAISDIVYETETFGYSEVESVNTTRKVLYGVPHHTTADTSSLSWKNYDSASLYASQSVSRFRIRARIIEPIGPLHTASRFEKVWTAPGETSLNDTIHFSTASTDTASATFTYNSSNEFVSLYTSSWIGVQLSSSDFNSGKQWKYTSGSILHKPTGETGFTTASGDSTTVTVFDTQPTVFSNFKTETETFGHSNIPIQISGRTVLYGNTTTDINSASYESHANSGSYASHSVARTRMLITITEPVGPLQHTASVIEKMFNNEAEKTETISFGTASSGFEASRSFFTEVGEFVTEYTSSWIGKTLAPDTWSISTGSVVHDPYGENSANSSSFTATTLTVTDTLPTQIDHVVYETEIVGYSEEGSTDAMRTVLYGVPHHTLPDSSSFEYHDKVDEYAQQSVTRFRIRARIIEPVGPLHTASLFEKVWTNSSDNQAFSSSIHFSSASTDTASSEIAYDDLDRLVAHYTSSWIGQQLSSSIGSAKTWTYTSGSILHEPTGENKFTTASGDSTQLVVNDTTKTQIDQIIYETETCGYSEVDSRNTLRTVLYGDRRVTNKTSQSLSWETHDSASLYASHSVTRFKMRMRITEPVGPLHHISNIEQIINSPIYSTSSILNFHTGSTDVFDSSSAYDSSNRLVTSYTSSYIGHQLSASANTSVQYTFTSGSFTHNPYGETGFVSASGVATIMTVHDTPATIIDNILLETETFGYSGIATRDSQRKVLYGVPHHTIADTSSLSWENHDSASLYASQSVTQFQFKARIIEPIGYHITGSTIQKLYYATDTGTLARVSDMNSLGEVLSVTPTQDEDMTELFDGATDANVNLSDSNTTIVWKFETPRRIQQIIIKSNWTLGISVPMKIYGSTDNLNYSLIGNSSVSDHDVISDTLNVSTPISYYKIEIEDTDLYGISEIEFYELELSETSVTDNIVLDTSKPNNFESSSSIYNSDGNLVSEYTSSWIGQQLSSSNFDTGTNWIYTIGQITHEPVDESVVVLNTAIIKSASINIKDTQPTLFSNFKTETETFGHSNIPAQNSTRTVLYGNTTTDINSASYESHVNSGSYASHSVARFRITATITEPVGPLHHTASVIEKMFNDDATKTETISFGTASAGFETSRSFFTEVGEFVTEYTTSFEGKALAPDTWSISTTVKHDPYGENSANSSSFTPTTMIVNDTTPTAITNIVYETETFGYSETGSTDAMRTVLYGVPRHTTADSASFENHDSASVYASHSVSRFRILTTITEPLGPLHTSSLFTEEWSEPGGDEIFTNSRIFSTASTDTASSEIAYDSQDRLVSHYTSSWIGRQLSSSDNSSLTWKYTSGSITHTPDDLSGFVTTSGESTQLVVNDTAAPIIKNVRIEYESFGGSNIGRQNIANLDNNASDVSRSILYGETLTRANTTGLDGHPGIYSTSSMLQFRILADIEEPVGPLHHTASILTQINKSNHTAFDGSTGTSLKIASPVFSTSSADIYYSQSAYDPDTSQLKVSYTSSWIGLALPNNSHDVDTDISTYYANIWHGYHHNAFNPDSTIDAIPDDGYAHGLHPSGENAATTIDPTGITNLMHPAAWSNPNIYLTSASSWFTVSASKPLEVSNAKVEIETFYSSSEGEYNGTTGVTRTLLYGFNRTISASDADTIGDIWSGSAAVRVRVLTSITEPIGFAHFPTEFTMSVIGEETKQHGFALHTASLDTSSRSDRLLNNNGQFVTHYTSSFNDTFTFAAGDYGIGLIVNTSSAVIGTYADTDFTGDGLNKSIESQQNLTIAPSPATAITNLRIEAETVSGSGIGTAARTTTILHGNTVTEATKSINAGYPTETARQQLTSVRLLADIAEPFGPHHTASVFTINGYNGNSHTIRFNTGSTDVSSSVTSSWYAVDGNQSTSYTSSFVPIEMAQGVKTLTVSNIDHEFKHKNTDISTFSQTTPTDSIITVIGPRTASVFVTPQTGSSFFSSSVDIDKYVTYDSANDIVVDIISGISASAPPITSESILTFPQYLNILYTELESELSFSPVTGDSGNEDTGSLTISNASMDDFTEVKEFTINVSGSDILPGSGSSGNSSLTFSVIPARPQSMDGAYWSSAKANLFSSHDSTGEPYGDSGISLPQVNSNTRRLYEGSLADGLGTNAYGPGDAPGSVVTNIVMAKDTPTGPTNYTMSFTPISQNATGNYGDNDRLFDHGDSGSLIVRINGVEVVNANLQSNFDHQVKDTSQTISGYNIGGFSAGTTSFTGTHAGKGRLILTRVEPFNGVSQNISAAGVHYPNGYQGWSARIELDAKLNEGYNKLDFSHSFDDDTSQKWTAFDWYYDDGVHEPAISPDPDLRYSWSGTGTEPTISLSGVSFIDAGAPFTASVEASIINVVAQTYRESDGSTDYILHVSEASDQLEIAPPGEGYQTSYDITLDNANDLNGFRFGEGQIPFKNETASLDIIAEASGIANTELGVVLSANLAPYHRNFDSANDWTEQGATSINVGRFIDISAIGTVASTTEREYFYSEEYRWSSHSMEMLSTQPDPGNLSGANVTSNVQWWIDPSKSDYNSYTSILNTDDLQVQWNGELKYPTDNYVTKIPNEVDYSTANSQGDRYYYRAFFIGRSTGNLRNLYVYVKGDFTRRDIFATDPGTAEQPNGTGVPDNIDALPIRIDVKLPGPISGNQNGTSPGTEWGVITGGSGGGSAPNTENWVSSTSIYYPAGTVTDNGTTVPAGTHAIRMNFGAWNLAQTGGVILVRIRLKSSGFVSSDRISEIFFETD